MVNTKDDARMLFYSEPAGGAVAAELLKKNQSFLKVTRFIQTFRNKQQTETFTAICHHSALYCTEAGIRSNHQQRKSP